MKISVILPIYNVEKYLEKCLNSVIGQSYSSLEIILVNDGSTDSCPRICEDYANRDSRIKVIHKKNGGLSEARNFGLDIATGDYIAFVDSDDILNLDYCQKLLNAIIENDADIAECGFYRFEDEQELKNISGSNEKNVKIYTTITALESLMKGPLDVMVWNKLYRKAVIETLQFPVGKINEDVFYTYRAIGNAKKIVKILEVLYFYRKQENSIMRSGYSIRRLDGLEGLEGKINYMKKNFPALEKLAIRNFCFGAMSSYRLISQNKSIDSDGIHRNRIKSKVNQYYRFSNWKNWHWKDILWLHIWLISPKVYMKLRDYYDRKSDTLQLVNS